MLRLMEFWAIVVAFPVIFKVRFSGAGVLQVFLIFAILAGLWCLFGGNNIIYGFSEFSSFMWFVFGVSSYDLQYTCVVL